MHNNPVNNIDPTGMFATFTNVSISLTIGAALIGGIAGYMLGGWKGAVYGALAGASLSGLAILAYLTSGGGINGILEGGWAVAKTAGAALFTAFLAVLAENSVDYIEGNEKSSQHYEDTFLRIFSLACMTAFAYGFIEYGLKQKGLFDKFVSKFIDEDEGGLVLSLLVGFGIEFIKAMGTGTIFKDPGKFFLESLISAGATYMVVKFDWSIRYAEEHTEELASALCGFIIGRIVEFSFL